MEKDRRLQVLGYGSGSRSRRLYVRDISGQEGWISFAAQREPKSSKGKRLKPFKTYESVIRMKEYEGIMNGYVIILMIVNRY